MMESTLSWVFAVICAGLLLAGLGFEGFALVTVPRAAVFTVCGIGGALAAVLLVVQRPNGGLPMSPAALSIAGLLLFSALWGALYLAPVPGGLAQAISPYWTMMRQAREGAGLEPVAWTPLGLAPQAGLDAVNQWLASLGFFLMAIVACRNRGARYVVLGGVIGLAMIEGWWGLGRYVLGNAARANAALYNPNHHAAAVLLGLPPAIALVVRGRGGGGDDPLTQTARGDRALLVGVLIAAAALGWLVSFSRSSLLVGVGALVAWALWENRRALGLRVLENPAALLTGAVVGVLAMLILIGVAEEYGERFDPSQAGQLKGRVEFWLACLSAFAASYGLGVGPGGGEFILNIELGNFIARKVPVHAHNDYVQYLAEMGLVGLVVGGGLFLAAVWMIMRRFIRRGSRSLRFLQRAVVVGVATLLLHSFTDFPLRIPTIGFQTLAALAFVCSARALTISDSDE